MKIESEVHHELTQLGEHARQAQVRPLLAEGISRTGAKCSMCTLVHMHVDVMQTLHMSANQTDMTAVNHQTVQHCPP